MKYLKYLKQILIITAITILAYLLNYLLPIPLPASIYGIFLLFLALNFKIIKFEQIKDVGQFLIFILPLLLVPMGVGLMDSWAALSEILIPTLVIAFSTTLIVLFVTGKVVDAVIRRDKK